MDRNSDNAKAEENQNKKEKKYVWTPKNGECKIECVFVCV